jgi:hypothetical protein
VAALTQSSKGTTRERKHNQRGPPEHCGQGCNLHTERSPPVRLLALMFSFSVPGDLQSRDRHEVSGIFQNIQRLARPAFPQIMPPFMSSSHGQCLADFLTTTEDAGKRRKEKEKKKQRKTFFIFLNVCSIRCSIFLFDLLVRFFVIFIVFFLFLFFMKNRLLLWSKIN